MIPGTRTVPALDDGALATTPARQDVRKVVNATGRARVAMLSTWHPEPADNGRKQRTRGMMGVLSEQYDVLLVSLLSPEEINQPLPKVESAYKQIALSLPTYESRSLRGLAGVAHRYPRSTIATWSAETARELADYLVTEDVRVVIGTDLRTLRYLAALPAPLAKVIDEPDVSPFVVRNPSKRPSPSALRERFREWKYRNLLGENLPRIDASVVASTIEADALQHLVTTRDVHILPNAIDSLPACQWGPAAARPQTLLYTGSLTYAPNAEAVAFLINQVVPRLEPQLPGVQVTVTGSLPDSIPADVDVPRLCLTGRLPNLEVAYLYSRIFVAPLWSGTGTRIKLIEAMAYGMPIVSTTKGAEGLPVQDGIHLLLADNADDFANAVLRLCDDPGLSLNLGTNARRLVKNEFTWERQGRGLCDLLDGVLSRHGATP
jgi:polysaccharide biosynthesis protein PslH